MACDSSSQTTASRSQHPSQENCKAMKEEPSVESTQSISSLDISRDILREILKIYNPPEASATKSKKHKTRSRSNVTDSTSADSQMHDTAPLGLRRIGQLVRQPVTMGHYKAAVMIIGNISAGKSTFINWYVQEAVQKTGMAIETSGFTYISSGRYVTEIGGESTLALRPQLQKLALKFNGFLENLCLKTCPSKDGRLHLVDLIDSPGLADGELQYPFDVEEVIFEMRRHVDLFLVFFDPIGQALGKRMLSIVKKLNDACPDKIRFCLTKIDEVRTEEERIKVMCQTTQSLTAKISSRHGFDLIPLYIPGARNGTYLTFTRDSNGSEFESDPPVVNRLADLVDDIERTTERRIQDALNTLSADVNKLTAAVDSKVEEYSNIQQQAKIQQMQTRYCMIWRIVIAVLGIVVAILHLKSTRHFAPFVVTFVDDWIDKIHPTSLDYLNLIVHHLESVPHLFPVLWVLFSFLFMLTIPFKATQAISRSYQEEYSKFLECREFLSMAKLRFKQLNRSYLGHAINESEHSSND